jgi:hypothetical protein
VERPWHCLNPQTFRSQARRQRSRQPQASLALKSSSAAVLFAGNTKQIHYSFDAVRRVSCVLAPIPCATQQALSLPWTIPPCALDVESIRKSTIACCSDYSGTRWQPNIPRPPQFLRGVSCICTVSAGPPEVLGRSVLTVIGSCALLASCLFVEAPKPPA